MGQKIDTQKFIKYLEEKWKGNPCPICKTAKWNVSDGIYELREFNHGSMVIGSGQIIPVVPIICSNCGNTVLVNAFISKTLDQ